MDTVAVPCVIMRGGTSKAVFFKAADMPQDRNEWESFLLKVMGSPDKRQIDGLGGANSLTSKVAIIGPGSLEEADVDYTFAQVSLTDAKVDFKGNCGNISSAVGPYAVNEGLFDQGDGEVTVRIHNTNTGKIIHSSFRVEDGMACSAGDLEIPGVPGTGAPIEISFFNSEGAVTGSLLPTGNPQDTLETSFGTLSVSIVDAANPLVFIKAGDLGLTGTESPWGFNDEILGRIEEIRSVAAEICGFSERKIATKESPAVPKATIVGAPQNFSDIRDRHYEGIHYDVSIRMMSMQKPHQALAITGAVCIAMAAQVPGTVVNEIAPGKSPTLLIGHPGGIMKTEYFKDGSETKVTVLRTARPLMKGAVYIKKN